MAIVKLEDRTDRLFGRDADLERIRARAGQTGLTAIVGPPQIGKSWLLMELARGLTQSGTPPCLIGFTRSPRGAHDPLLQVVSDLYQRWLSDTAAWEQIKMVWQQQKNGLLPAFAKFVGKLSEKAAKVVPGVGEMMGTAIRESLEGLVAASEDLRTGRLIVSRIEYSQAQDLVGSVYENTGKRVVLVLDQWEETLNLELQCNAFRDFLREPEQWAGCHFVLGAREGSDAADRMRDLQREYPSSAYIHSLAEMDLAALTERRRLVGFLHAQPQLRAIEISRTIVSWTWWPAILALSADGPPRTRAIRREPSRASNAWRMRRMGFATPIWKNGCSRWMAIAASSLYASP